MEANTVMQEGLHISSNSSIVDPLAFMMSAADSAGLVSGEVQTECGHQVNVKKLKIICDMVLSGYECVTAIFITPGTLFTTRLEELDLLTFDVILSELTDTWKEEGPALIEYFLRDEYPEFKGSVEVNSKVQLLPYNDNPSYILMSIRKHDSVYGRLDWNDMNILSTMISNGIPVAIPYSWGTIGRKCILALVEDIKDIYSLRNHMLSSINLYGINVSHGVIDTYPNEWHYITAIAKEYVPYGLPYEIINKNILEQQIRAIDMK